MSAREVASRIIDPRAFSLQGMPDGHVEDMFDGWANEAYDKADRILQALDEEAGGKCGKENCMGWKNGQTAKWVREERLLAVIAERDALQRRSDALTSDAAVEAACEVEIMAGDGAYRVT